MSFDDVRSASVIRYPYLWAREAAAGMTEGTKRRPTAVALRISRKSGDILLIFPITSQQPEAGRQAAEIPDTEKQRAGLDASLRLWIILDEVNKDVIGRSWYLEPDPVLGHFSKRFFGPLLAIIKVNLASMLTIDRQL